MSEIRATTISNAAGTGPITMTGQYAAKAWVNFNGTGTVAIRESGNVSSITDNTTGDYTVNFTTAMPDTNYSMAGAAKYNGSTDPTAIRYVGISSGATLASVMQTTSLRVIAGYANGFIQDPDVCTVNIIR
jgi:hypothetical protein